ncbi:hypothetical protein Ade02nite_55790 [Paractinoplanes deccanensis]|uniref:Immunity protein 35 domain-containing protein n=1 Tax=Paractinoplanes deccanensis TaxID=113561 RepID=A0ABQ3YAE8_9ACTN|nr:YrhB domain-containing protein [Actinoplanes deccanensis]GID76938.1 hypothetical protein Ade02nite_55790 [Actinoplanes deccanensis]
MMSRDEARARAENFLDEEVRSRIPFDVVIIETAIGDGGDAWIFPYDGRGWVERGDARELLAGNAPVSVSKRDGAVRYNI